MKELQPLRGMRRELTKELFEELCALQCGVPEILGHIGVTEDRLARWVRRGYRLELADAVEMLRQDGLIEIRRAGFDQLRRSATLINQQHVRFLSAPADAKEAASEKALEEFIAMTSPGEKEVEELFR